MKSMSIKKNNSGFIHLDYVFEQNFKRPLQQRDPEFYDKIKNLSIEEFVSEMMSLRKELDSFTLFRSEYNEAEKSIARRSSISWKETLAAFSYSMNYPAKHFSAEDMLRLKKNTDAADYCYYCLSSTIILSRTDGII
jgi:hypothetical protein